MIPIKHTDLALPVSAMFALHLMALASDYLEHESITINFRDPKYSPENGGFHPVEIRLEKDKMEGQTDCWRICYITDFAYVGYGQNSELVKELDFDFDCGLFQTLFGTFAIEGALDMYQIWEGNFIHYWQVLKPFEITIST